ncbi:MAG: protein translocase subunit SecD [Gammaproteobacteria bacterium]|jgi:preprotein translocase subunit SecD|nr:protein translocase subunit SecD [Gammaproteobacteria bacterium]
MNKYPLWKNLLIVAVLLISIVYAVPNLFPEDPAVQVSHSNDLLDEGVKTKVSSELEQASIPYNAIEMSPEQLLVRFANTEEQLEAADLIKSSLSGDYIVALNLAPATPGWLRVLNASPMNLGLDLRGGVYFLLEVDMDAAVKQALNRYEGDFRGALRKEKIRYLGVTSASDTITVKFRDAEAAELAYDLLRGEYGGDLRIEQDTESDPPDIKAIFKETALRELKKFALQQNITTLRKRVNELGVAEPVIQQQGENRVAVQLPGVQDTARAKEILGATATLEFRLVDEKNDAWAARDSGRIPVGDRLYFERNGNPVLLKRRVMLTGDYITDAASGIDKDSAGPAVFITLDGKGARLFSKVSGDNVGRLMAVVFIENKTETVKRDGEAVRKTRKVEEVINIARIREQLSKRFQITGLDSTREARKLALLLRAGALAAPMEIVEERTVGPSLGQQNIDQGFKSVVVGVILVMVFMAVYYRVFGLVADLALLANLVLIVAIMSMIPGATLTLPGIAGIVLTVGMAVDANVLIFERIREELRLGNSPQASIEAGYGKALSTIADANITTLIAAIVLFGFGTGPIKGFAVTLSIGILASMFTAIMGTRAVINLIYGSKRSPVLAI